jgi:copper oxidase (laccase) domain-containing protein
MRLMSVETYAPLTEIPYIEHAFSLRNSDFDPPNCATAEQPHGNRVAVLQQIPENPVPDVDALATNRAELPLLIRCADCAAIFFVDRKNRAIALAHSGKKGTQTNIVAAVVSTLCTNFGTQPADLRALISPCIGPCHYEMDLWSGIETQLRDCGVTDIHNLRICTACNLNRYYSYRAEKGHTGRMLAYLKLKQ